MFKQIKEQLGTGKNVT